MACVALGGETVTGNPGHLGVFIIARPSGEGNTEGAFHFKTWPYGGSDLGQVPGTLYFLAWGPSLQLSLSLTCLSPRLVL